MRPKMRGSNAITWTIVIFGATFQPASLSGQEGKPRMTLHGHSGSVMSLAFSPDGKTLVSGGGTHAKGGVDRSLKLWNVATGRNIASFDGQSAESAGVRSVAFSPDGKLFVSAGDDTMVWIWDVASLKNVAKLKGGDGIVWSTAFSPNGKTLAAASGKTVTILDLAA